MNSGLLTRNMPLYTQFVIVTRSTAFWLFRSLCGSDTAALSLLSSRTGSSHTASATSTLRAIAANLRHLLCSLIRHAIGESLVVNANSAKVRRRPGRADACTYRLAVVKFSSVRPRNRAARLCGFFCRCTSAARHSIMMSL